MHPQAHDRALPPPPHDTHVLSSVISPRLVLAGPDTLHFSADISVSDAVHAKLDQEKEMAQSHERAKTAHCPEWLGAQVHPHGSRGGYAYLLETDDFSVKVLGKGIPHRPGFYVELRSHFLHAHPNGPAGACREAVAWVRDHLLADQDEQTINRLVGFEGVRLSRADLHCDWQGGWVPNPADASCFIKPARVKWQAFSDGTTFTGFIFGRGDLQARIYRKSLEAHQKRHEDYFALLQERAGDQYDPGQDAWRLEYQLRRAGATGFKLYREPDLEDDEATIEAELAAEDLPHVGTLPRFFAHQGALWQHLTSHTLRLVVPDPTQRNRARWPVHPTWQALQEQYERVAGAGPLSDEGRQVVRGARYEGKRRLLGRMLLGVIASLEVEDAAPASAALAALSAWVDRAARLEGKRAEARRARYAELYGNVPRWVERGMGERLAQVEQVRHRVQMLLGICSARGVLPLELKPAYNVVDLLDQHVEDLEAEAAAKGGVWQVMADHFQKVYRVAAPRALMASQR
jgi:hypothetical protein